VTDTDRQQSLVLELSNALSSLHKEQFGRGPTRVRTHFAGPDITVTVFEDALLPAEKALVEMGEAVRVQETRIFLQDATRERFIAEIERITRRKVASFHSTCDARAGVVMEIAVLEPRPAD
jgi:uncharacterized protein YbcI